MLEIRPQTPQDDPAVHRVNALAIELQPGALGDIHGKVKYPPAFEGV